MKILSIIFITIFVISMVAWSIHEFKNTEKENFLYGLRVGDSK